MSNSTIPPTPSPKDYTQDPQYREQAARNTVEIFDRDEPFSLFSQWMAEARAHEPNDGNAMSLATVDRDGNPDVRIVLLKKFSPTGFVFYSNRESSKGNQLSEHPVAALCLHWKSLRRQVRIKGRVESVSEADADAYFASRARGSQIGAWASDQSRPLASRELFEERIRATEAEYDQDAVIPRPPYWTGWRVVPEQIEFWRDRPFRLHDRLRFTRSGDDWTKERLFP
ncbi:MAG: pyridoxamine 5'-phosphate oxidase [Hellea sp.]|nr:pyridoxamine 5'-phosphate oxidase [Hellea sp.]